MKNIYFMKLYADDLPFEGKKTVPEIYVEKYISWNIYGKDTFHEIYMKMP